MSLNSRVVITHPENELGEMLEIPKQQKSVTQVGQKFPPMDWHILGQCRTMLAKFEAASSHWPSWGALAVWT